jgi:hypothetical protein
MAQEKSLADYTEAEFIELIYAIDNCSIEGGQDELVC